MKLIVTPNCTNGLCEVGQSVPVKVAICVETEPDVFANVTAWIKCRDYFNDLVWVQHTHYDQPIVKYGFEWSYSEALKQDIENTGRLKIALMCHTDEFAQNFEANNHLIIDADKRIGCKATTIIKLSASEVDNQDWGEGKGDNKHWYLINADKKWFSNSPILSLYTLLIRACCNKKLLGHTDFEKAFVDLSTDASFSCESDGGLIKQCAREPKAWKAFLDHWEAVLGWAPQPINEAIFTANGHQYSQGKLLQRLHDNTGIASMMHAVRTKPDDDKNSRCSGLHAWAVKFHEEVLPNV